MRLVIAAAALLVVSIALFCFIGPDANKTTYEDPIEPEDIPGFSTTIMTDGTGTGSYRISEVSEDLNVTFLATPSTGSSFLGWYEAGELISSTTSVTVPADSDRTLTATFGSSDQVLRAYTWSYNDHTESGDVSRTDTWGYVFSTSEYDTSISDPEIPRRAAVGVSGPNVLVDSTDPVVSATVDHLRALAPDATDLEIADMALRFVQQAIVYTEDGVLYEADEFWATPMEALYSKAGDCEDSAAAFCAIADGLGLDAAIVMFDTHCGAAVSVAGVTGGTEFVVGSVTYTYCETSSDSYIPIGVLSSTYDPVDATVMPIGA